jgi:hypothetical protein
MPAPLDTGIATNITQSLTITYNGVAGAQAGQIINYNGSRSSSPATTMMGVLREAPVLGQPCSVAVAGLVEVLSGGAVAIENGVTTDANGNGVVAAAGQHILGRALSAATAAGQRFQVLITKEGAA